MLCNALVIMLVGKDTHSCEDGIIADCIISRKKKTGLLQDLFLLFPLYAIYALRGIKCKCHSKYLTLYLVSQRNSLVACRHSLINSITRQRRSC